MRHINLLLLACLSSSCAQEEQAADEYQNWARPIPYTNVGEQVQFDDLDSMKAAYPSVDEWILHEFEGRRYVFCQVAHPGFGVSRETLHGWHFEPRLDGWRHLVTLNALNLGNPEIVFSGDGSECRFRGRANNQFRGADALVADLRVAQR